MPLFRFLGTALLGAALTTAGLTSGAAAQQPAGTFRNPLRNDGPDPWVTQHRGYYYYTNTTGSNITLWKTKALSQLRDAPAAVVWTPPATGPNSRDIWAPELHFLDGKWYLYYTATDQASPGDNARYVFVLENASADPTTGRWTDKGKVNTQYPGLDGSVFEHGGQRYFVYSAYVGAQSVLAIAPMQTPWALRPGQEVIIARPTYDWEKGGGRQILEGPEFLPGKKGQLLLVYSASACWDDNYSLGMLVAAKGSNPLRPESWTKTPSPVFYPSAENAVWGTGHNCFTKSPDGREDWIVYHAKTAADGKCAGRSSRMQRFTWNPDGTPTFGAPVSLTQPQLKPSGE
ncbi:glycoside hydrolase family 43 protein [Hymenobacter sp. HSC-4F20]|uniref:glycoside hydrolase family 43 protein n=1 Tax=Hymenobacter sp. HSC-4F20 TaxID=2864135 RepID=UPI001C72CAFE|nr:glycoside hydrolase family 43 protein [Hymenobacter sp. HSC-4F20]MBX0292325.1 glycoside hydrolase family 43 protein [Hymenobacter sp. HSC-4F20]